MLFCAWPQVPAAASTLGIYLRAYATELDRAAAVKTVPPASSAPAISKALNTWIGAGLAAARNEKSAKARAADLRAMAASLRNAADLTARPRPAAPKNLAVDVAAVLADPAYRSAAPVVPVTKKRPSWLAQMWLAFLKWWGNLLGRAFSAAINTPIVGNITASVLIIAATVALVFLIIRIAVRVSARQGRGRGASTAGTPLEFQASADETYDAARAAARSGSYGPAIALLFLAALLALDRSGRVPYDPARTAGEYRRAVRRSAAGAASSFETIARAFTYVAYAQMAADENDWRAADAAFASMSFNSADRL